ncbi:MAG: hypothetical protein OEY64_05805 [Nitrospinota bacterium]|nr:hypothetical protein [Nitrospinota bacterium]
MTTENTMNIASEVIQTRIASIWLGNDGIIRCVNRPDSNETLEDAQAFSSAVKKLSPEKIHPALADIRNIKSTTREARRHYASIAQELGPACAILVGSPLTSAIGNFFLKIDRPNIPTKLFYTENAALQWLGGFLK